MKCKTCEQGGWQITVTMEMAKEVGDPSMEGATVWEMCHCCRGDCNNCQSCAEEA